MPNAEKWRESMLKNFEGTPEEKEQRLKEYMGRLAMKAGSVKGTKKGFAGMTPEKRRAASEKGLRKRWNK